MPLFKRLFGKSTASAPPAPVFDAPLTPADPVFVIGDLHGCARQMRDLQAQMQARDPDAHQVYVGDYVDRGDHSKEVLEALFALRDDPKVTCLRGNHEDMMLAFLADPTANNARWLRYGGLNTLGSYGIAGVTHSSPPEALQETMAKFQAALSPDMQHWLEALPSVWQSGNLAVVHAAADPGLPIALQADQTLKWGHQAFFSTPRSDGIWVAHGHTIVEEAGAEAGRIAVDTGAYATGRLTAAYITPETLDFLQAG